jgi:recombination protein RecA
VAKSKNNKSLKETVEEKMDLAMSEINKKYGKGTILKCSEAKNLTMDRLETGIFELDLKIGGGVPRGRITTLSGDFSTGKSAMCMLIVANAQRKL